MDYRLREHDDQALYETMLAMPKIELHRHLEGSLRLGTIADIAEEFEIKMPGKTIEEFRNLVQIMPMDTTHATVFLSKFTTLRKFYRSEAVVRRIAYETVADAAAENIVYMELRFTPVALANAIQTCTLADATTWVTEAVAKASKDFNIDVKLITSMNRHESVELGQECVKAAIAHMDRGVVGIDLAGAEHQFKGAPFKQIFDEAREAGLEITIHAGEWAGPDSIREAVDVLGATRIGHGVRVVEDPAMMQIAIEKQIAFEICITSNMQSGVVMNVFAHPVIDLHRLGCLTTLNTDDPSISAINLTDELMMAMDIFGFSMDDIKQQTMNAAQVAFLPETEKNALIARLQSELYSTEEKTA